MKMGPVSTQSSRTTAPAASAKQEDAVDDDEEEGRAAMLSKKRRANAPQKKPKDASGIGPSAQVIGDAPGSAKETPVRSAPSKGRKKATSYLDEILAERAKKRKKR